MKKKVNFEKEIRSLRKEDFKLLFDLIPKIKSKSKFGTMKGGEKTEDGVIIMPFIVSDEVVLKFHSIVYKIPIIISATD